MVTVVFAVAVPPGPAQVRVYSVVARGEIVFVPVVGTEPTPWSIEQEVALVDDHDKTDEPPGPIVDGVAQNPLQLPPAPPPMVGAGLAIVAELLHETEIC